MANADMAWDERPEYLAYTDWTPIPGTTSYAFARNGSGTDVTQFHPGQAFLSEHNLPDIMYQLHPCVEWRRFKNTRLPGPKYDADGSPVYEQYTRPGKLPRQLLDFKILPDKISTKEGWWYHEFVRRMDPRIRQLDIIMREEVCAERLRMTDQRYINIHLNTPAYRTYRPAWMMTAWHGTIKDATQNQRQQDLLDRLTDAQKQANTTRGSTPGLINPALGEIPGNRVPIPAYGLKKRGPKPAAVKVNMVPIPQSVQVTQGPQTAFASYQAPQIQQTQHPSRAKRSNPTIPSSSGVSASVEALSHDSTNPAVTQEHNDLRTYADAKARDAAAMPPPSLPVKARNVKPSRPQAFSSHHQSPYSTNHLPELDHTQADFAGSRNLRAEGHEFPEPEYPFLSDEEIATMSARSEEAMAEILWMGEPFLDPCSSLQGPPPIDLSAELIEDLGAGFLFPSHEGRSARGKSGKNTIPNPAPTVQAQNLEQRRQPLLSEKQRGKRKEYDDEDGNFQNVQLDVERQERRPVKRVKSVHGTKLGNSSGEHQVAAYNFQQQPHFAPQPRSYQSGYIPEQMFGGPAVQDTQPSQHASFENATPYAGKDFYEEQNRGMIGQYPEQMFGPHHPQSYPRPTYPYYQPTRDSPISSSYLPVSAPGDSWTIRDERSHDLSSIMHSGGPVERFSNGGF